MAAPVRVELRKWPDDPHWEYDAVLLGEDEHGRWVGIAEGTLLSSPRRSFNAVADHVTLVPRASWWMATFYGEEPQRPFDVYVDMTTQAVWHHPGLVRAVDLDLDVVKGTTGRVWIDDEHEFAEHRVSLGYPDEVAAAAVSSAEEVRAAVAAGTPPYDGTHRGWIDRLHRLRR